MLLEAGYEESSIMIGTNIQHDKANIQRLRSHRTSPALFFMLRLLKIHSVNWASLGTPPSFCK